MSQVSAIAQRENSRDSLRHVLLREARPSDALPPVVARMLSCFRGGCTLGELSVRAQISKSKAETVVRKLTQLGIVGLVQRPRVEAPVVRPGSGFTALEEAFFASEVQPIDECDEPHVTLGERIDLLVSELVLKLKGSPACY